MLAASANHHSSDMSFLCNTLFVEVNSTLSVMNVYTSILLGLTLFLNQTFFFLVAIIPLVPKHSETDRDFHFATTIFKNESLSAII